MPRLFREAPVNAIWEGSGNVQCLDMRAPSALAAGARSLFRRGRRGARRKRALDAHVAALKDEARDLSGFEAKARDLCDRLAVGLQAAALIRAGSPVAAAFCRSRIESRGAHHYGALTGVDTRAIVTRAAPR